ncbi:general substrate transporter [Sarracenia purpurea var. burkii]
MWILLGLLGVQSRYSTLIGWGGRCTVGRSEKRRTETVLCSCRRVGVDVKLGGVGLHVAGGGAPGALARRREAAVAVCLATTVVITKKVEITRYSAVIHRNDGAGGATLSQPDAAVRVGALALLVVLRIPLAVSFPIAWAWRVVPRLSSTRHICSTTQYLVWPLNMSFFLYLGSVG